MAEMEGILIAAPQSGPGFRPALAGARSRGISSTSLRSVASTPGYLRGQIGPPPRDSTRLGGAVSRVTQRCYHLPAMGELREKHVVLGGGLVGAVWSLFLARRGLPVRLFELRPDPRISPFSPPMMSVGR